MSEVYKYALINNDIITNIIMSDHEFAEVLRAENQHVIQCPADAGIGWTHLNGAFVDPANAVNFPVLDTAKTIDTVKEPEVP